MIMIDTGLLKLSFGRRPYSFIGMPLYVLISDTVFSVSDNWHLKQIISRKI